MSLTNRSLPIPPTPPTVDKPELKLYNIQLHKVSEEGKGLLGAVFGLYEADGTTPVANPYGERSSDCYFR